MSSLITVSFTCGHCVNQHVQEIRNAGQSVAELVPCGWLVRYSRSGDQLDIICPKCQTAAQRDWMRQQTAGKSAIDVEIIDVTEESVPQLTEGSKQ